MLTPLGEIDVAFRLGQTRFILEAKWHESKIDYGPIALLDARIRQRIEGTLGLFVSMSGYTSPAVEQISSSGTRVRMLLFDSEHVEALVEGSISPEILIDAALEEAATTGRIYVSLSNLVEQIRQAGRSSSEPDAGPSGSIERINKRLSSSDESALGDGSIVRPEPRPAHTQASSSSDAAPNGQSPADVGVHERGLLASWPESKVAPASRRRLRPVGRVVWLSFLYAITAFLAVMEFGAIGASVDRAFQSGADAILANVFIGSMFSGFAGLSFFEILRVVRRNNQLIAENPRGMSFDDNPGLMWGRIVLNAGATFRLVRGAEFTYKVQGDKVIPDRTQFAIPRSHFERAWSMRPLRGPGQINAEIIGPSYVFSILTDPRIVVSQEPRESRTDT